MRKKYTQGTAAAMKELLLDLPAKDPNIQISTKSFIHLIAPELSSALQKGYSLDELQRVLDELGIAIAPSTLQTYMREWRNNSSKSERTSPKRRAKNVSSIQAEGSRKSEQLDSDSVETSTILKANT